jgi:hypothetical protein
LWAEKKRWDEQMEMGRSPMLSSGREEMDAALKLDPRVTVLVEEGSGKLQWVFV